MGLEPKLPAVLVQGEDRRRNGGEKKVVKWEEVYMKKADESGSEDGYEDNKQTV